MNVRDETGWDGMRRSEKRVIHVTTLDRLTKELFTQPFSLRSLVYKHNFSLSIHTSSGFSPQTLHYNDSPSFQYSTLSPIDTHRWIALSVSDNLSSMVFACKSSPCSETFRSQVGLTLHRKKCVWYKKHEALASERRKKCAEIKLANRKVTLDAIRLKLKASNVSALVSSPCTISYFCA